MAKVRVYQLAAELGTDSKTLLSALKGMGEWVRSATSTLEAPVVKRVRELHTQGRLWDYAANSPSPVRNRPTTPVSHCAKKFRITAEQMAQLLTSEGLDPEMGVSAAVMRELTKRLIVNRNTLNGPQIMLIPGTPLHELNDTAPTPLTAPKTTDRPTPLTIPKASGPTQPPNLQQPHTVNEATVDIAPPLEVLRRPDPEAEQRRIAQLIRRQRARVAAEEREPNHRARLSRQYRDVRFGADPKNQREPSARWSQIHLVDHHKALVNALNPTRMQRSGLHRGTREALKDARMFWMPYQSVRTIRYSGTLDMAALLPRDIASGFVAFEALVPARPDAKWVHDDVPHWNDHTFRSLLWFIDQEHLHIVGWRHIHRAAAPDDDVTLFTGTHLRELPTDDKMRQHCASWPWIPTVHLPLPLARSINLDDLDRDERACLAAAALVWNDIEATRRPPRPTSERSPNHDKTPTTPVETASAFTAGTRFVKLSRTPNHTSHRTNPDHQAQRTYRFSWMVRGHTRHQHYGPGGRDIKLIEIAPHMRGPKTAPLLGPKVYLLPPPQ